MDISETVNTPFIVEARSEEETQLLAATVAAQLLPGDVLCLYGDLGAGKTTFTRGIVAALGSPALVSSPTFTLIHEYTGGRLPLFHMDAYRLQNADDAVSTGLADYLARTDSVTIIEWPERIATLLPNTRLDISITETNGGDGRQFVFTPQGTRFVGFRL